MQDFLPLNQRGDQLLIGFLAPLVERCKGIAKVIG